jgi:hypothetical protein
MRRTLVLILLFAGSCLPLPAQQFIDFCNLHSGSGALAAHSVQTPLTILNDILDDVGLEPHDITLEPLDAKDNPLVKGNAYAEPCPGPPSCKCIFYDPGYLPISPSPSADNWSAYAVLAHETGHFIKADPFAHRFDIEAAADNWAGFALGKLHAPVEAVMAGIDHVANSENSENPEEDTDFYFGRSHRRMDALSGYTRALGRQGVQDQDQPKPCGYDFLQKKVEGGFAVSFAAPWLGLYLKTDSAAGTPLKPEIVASCGSKPPPDVPTDFNRDLRGSCLLSRQKAGTQLTWDLVGLCKQ